MSGTYSRRFCVGRRRKALPASCLSLFHCVPSISCRNTDKVDVPAEEEEDEEEDAAADDQDEEAGDNEEPYDDGKWMLLQVLYYT